MHYAKLQYQDSKGLRKATSEIQHFGKAFSLEVYVHKNPWRDTFYIKIEGSTADQCQLGNACFAFAYFSNFACALVEFVDDGPAEQMLERL